MKENMLHQKSESYRFVLPLKKMSDWISDRQDKTLQHQNVHFEEKSPKVEKHNIFVFHGNLPQFCF